MGICMNPPKGRTNTITGCSVTEQNLFGDVKENKAHYDLMSAIMICLEAGEEAAENDLLRLLEVLLSSDKKADEKKEILERDFDIPMTEKLEGEVERMCNLSDGVEQNGIQKEKFENARSLLDILTDEEIAKRIKLPIEKVQRLRKESFA